MLNAFFLPPGYNFSTRPLLHQSQDSQTVCFILSQKTAIYNQRHSKPSRCVCSLWDTLPLFGWFFVLARYKYSASVSLQWLSRYFCKTQLFRNCSALCGQTVTQRRQRIQRLPALPFCMACTGQFLPHTPHPRQSAVLISFTPTRLRHAGKRSASRSLCSLGICARCGDSIRRKIGSKASLSKVLSALR